MTEKPLFIPLRAVHFAEFEAGTKTVEYRKYSPRWNLINVRVGRRATLSRGYNGKRIYGVVTSAIACHSSALSEHDRAAVQSCYGGDVQVICIGIKTDKKA
jgi:hypothetical protein